MPDTKVYRNADLKENATYIAQAAELWSKRCAEYMCRRGDRGSCVLGAGIAVNYRPPRCRKSIRQTIIGVPYTAGQGSLTWEDSVEEIINFLAIRGIESFYEPGHMD